jgi:hypothetical protein
MSPTVSLPSSISTNTRAAGPRGKTRGPAVATTRALTAAQIRARSTLKRSQLAHVITSGTKTEFDCKGVLVFKTPRRGKRDSVDASLSHWREKMTRSAREKRLYYSAPADLSAHPSAHLPALLPLPSLHYPAPLNSKNPGSEAFSELAMNTVGSRPEDRKPRQLAQRIGRLPPT